MLFFQQQVSKKYSTFHKNQLVFNEINMLINTKEKGKTIRKQILSQCRLLVYFKYDFYSHFWTFTPRVVASFILKFGPALFVNYLQMNFSIKKIGTLHLEHLNFLDFRSILMEFYTFFSLTPGNPRFLKFWHTPLNSNYFYSTLEPGIFH